MLFTHTAEMLLQGSTPLSSRVGVSPSAFIKRQTESQAQSDRTRLGNPSHCG